MEFDSDYASEVFQMTEDLRTSNFNSLRSDVQDIKEMIRKLYKQVDNYDAKRVELQSDFENLRKANKDFSLKVKDLHDILKNPPHVRVFSETSSPNKYIERLDTRSYTYGGSGRSSRSSSIRNDRGSAYDDYDDDDYLSDENYDERTFTKSAENFEIEDTSDA
ncbi:uncharacterized protein LOC110253132 isoform X2 [Exaiptasia diaphana]|uniref:Uncharacterized protein n=1 Tax=Exaiptasia diaphana TaxID=2652724 RepID=A0A913Y7S7_EXADI|nr:uncharacterized protein LOC110253132 isoform X2 [Exaiptasia diaphana]